MSEINSYQKNASQKCGHPRRTTCLLMTTRDEVNINGMTLTIRKDVNWKTKNCVYVCICKKCQDKNVYFGQTVQEYHNRMSHHRQKFDDEKYVNSALSLHTYDIHNGD